MKKEVMLHSAKSLLVERGAQYGEIRENFGRIASVATGLLGRPVSPYEIAAILLSVKLGRIPEDPAYVDSYVDGINYLAILGEFATENEDAK
ncbi:hypothetical protein UFOVP235_36 [uncultured Caudovirales phage]|uniref:DUF6378 domain-containing protein n=1 Tax=uncultured Caudovirales phage TaxID=2100421 RepID=A0A6J7WRE7_9CAUD|nr:hypothetical protein UFOVP235_36 [uncultured Caudovirales phage]